jgi:LacI family transcriptional regulator
MSKRDPLQPRVTLMDIANASGVSRATVSLVLRGSELVHADTRTKVEAEMQRQGYVRNRAAANLRQGTSTSVALVINDLSNPYFAEFAAGVDEALGAVGCVTLLGSTGESVERQHSVIQLLMEHMPAGIILSPAQGSDGSSLMRTIGTQTNVVVFNRELAGTDWDFLALDNRNGARISTEYLLSLGHRRIAFFGGHMSASSCRERRQGYLDAMANAGITPEPQWMIETAPTRLEAAAQAGALFVRDPAPTAAVAYNDGVALGLMMGLASRGRRPGYDFAVVGFDDIPEAAVSAPPLTTIATDPRARGRQAAEMILARAKNHDAPPSSLVAPVRLVVRQSAGVALEFQHNHWPPASH